MRFVLEVLAHLPSEDTTMTVVDSRVTHSMYLLPFSIPLAPTFDVQTPRTIAVGDIGEFPHILHEERIELAQELVPEETTTVCCEMCSWISEQVFPK